MSGKFKIPDQSKHEAALRRLFGHNVYERKVYFEEAVLADSETFASKGFRIFLLNNDEFYAVGKDAKARPMGIPFTEVELVDALSDPASFFGADVNSNHSRIVLSPGATHAAHLGSTIDFYSFYEDTKLFHMFERSWMFARMRQALPQLYSSAVSTDSPRIDTMPEHVAKVAFEALRDQILSAPPQALMIEDMLVRKLSLLEEIVVCICASRQFKRFCYEAPDFITFIVKEFEALNDLHKYMNEPSVDAMMIQLELDDLPAKMVELQLKYLSTIYCVASKMIAGSESLPPRLALAFLFPSSPTAMTDFLNASILYDPRAHKKGSRARRELEMRKLQQTKDRNKREETKKLRMSLTQTQLTAQMRQDADRAQREKMDNEFSHSRIAKQALECTHMQAELLYHVMNLFEHAMVVTSRSNLSLDTILTHFIKHMWFKTDRVHALFNGMCSLFEDNQVADGSDYYIYCYTSIFNRLLMSHRSGDLRKQVKQKCATALQYQFKNFVETLKLRIEQMDRATERKLDSDFYRFKMQRGTSDKQQGTDGNNESNDDNKNSNDNDNGNGTSNGNGNRNGNDGVNTALNDSTVSMATIDEHNMKMVKGGLDGLQAREEGKGVIDLDDERFLTHVPFFLRRAYPLLSHLSNKLIKK